MTGFLQRVEQNILSRRQLRRGQAVLVAVSGGLDSMVLLYALRQLADRHAWQLTVAHFNHRLRGRSSDADERLVRRTAAALKLPFIAGRADVKPFARKAKLSVEMAARKLRHEFLARTAKERNIRVVAVAHHADDQVELFFLRLLRGAGGEGLAGMKRSSPSPVNPKIVLVRPLLDAAKEELRQFASENKTRFREDATNVSTDFLRNRIRNELLPLLRNRYQPALNRAVLRLIDIIGAESEFAGEAARRWLGSGGEKKYAHEYPGGGRYSRRAVKRAGMRGGQRTARPALPAKSGEVRSFKDLPVALGRKILQRQLIELGVPATFELIEQLRAMPERRVSIGAGLVLVRGAAGRLALEAKSSDLFKSDRLAVRLSARAGEVIFDGTRLNWQFKDAKGVHPFRRREGCEYFDADRVGDRIILRHWQSGDRFQPIGMKSAVKLQDLFTNAKIPRSRRRQLIVAMARSGEIFWVEGLRISENFKLTLRSRRCLVWNWRQTGPAVRQRKA